MNWFSEMGRRLAVLFGRAQFDQDLEEEMRLHRQLREQQQIDQGLSEQEARRAARSRFGNPMVLREESREMWGWGWLEDTVQDVRYGLRMLLKNKGFTIVAVLSLALGIGANTAIFTLINNVMLKSLPVRSPEELVSLGKAEGGGAGLGFVGAVDIFPYEFYEQIEKHDEAFRSLCAYGSFPTSVAIRTSSASNEPATHAVSQLVSGNYFDVLGVNTILGRPIARSDADAPGRQPVAVISYSYWQRKLAGDPAVIGQTIAVNGAPFTLIGVAPPRFYGLSLEADPPDMWLPVTMQERVMLGPSMLGPGGVYWLHLMARLNPSVTTPQAQEWTTERLRQYMIDNEGTQVTEDRRQEIANNFVELVPSGRGVSHLRSEFSVSLRVLMGVVLLVLLIACANLVNFLLSKTGSREKEMAIRLALGAGRSRIVRQMLTEALMLSVIGGGLGLWFAYWGAQFLLNFVAAGAAQMPFDTEPDGRILVFTLAVSIATGLLFGLTPALRTSRASLSGGLKSGARTIGRVTLRPGRVSLPRVLIIAQVAVSLVLVMAAGLFVRTLRNLQAQSFGFNRTNVLLVDLDAKIAGYKEQQLGSLYGQILERLGARPGVRSVTFSFAPPISNWGWTGPIHVQGHPAKPHEDLHTTLNGVGPQYFETLGIPVIAGRAIGPQDIASSARVAVVNQTLAAHFFPAGNAVGSHASLPGVTSQQEAGQWEIVGVVADSKDSDPRDPPRRMTYVPMMQVSGDSSYATCLQLRTVGEPATIVAEVRNMLARIDSNLPITKVITLAEHVDRFMVPEALISRLSGFFSLLALLLACIGVYGVMTYNVVRRVNEIGIRMALGAKAHRVQWMVLKESLMLLGIGIGIGLPMTLGATQMIQAQLFGVSPTDPETIVIAVTVVVAVTVLSGYLPARRAANVDPMVALRYE